MLTTDVFRPVANPRHSAVRGAALASAAPARSATTWRRDRLAAGIAILLVAGGAAAERQRIATVVGSLARPLRFVAVPADQRPSTDASALPTPVAPPRGPLVSQIPTATAPLPPHVRTPASATLGSASVNPGEAVGTTGTASASADALAPVPSLPQPTGRLIEAVDTGKPVFSPSFAADRSAFFHDENQAAGAVVPAKAGGEGFVRVLSIAADRGHNYHPRLSPDGRTIAFDSDRDGVRGVYLASRDGKNVRRVSGPEYAAFPAWSPDGTRLAFIKSEPDQPTVWNLWSMDVKSGATTRLTTYRDGQPWGASWFPDGRRICYAHEDELVVLDTATNQTREFASPRPDRYVRMPAVSPDGTKVIFQVDNDGGWLLELSDGSMREVLADPLAEDFAWSPDGRQVVFHSRGGDWGSWTIAP